MIREISQTNAPSVAANGVRHLTPGRHVLVVSVFISTAVVGRRRVLAGATTRQRPAFVEGGRALVLLASAGHVHAADARRRSQRLTAVQGGRGGRGGGEALTPHVTRETIVVPRANLSENRAGIGTLKI